jgi:hypothetical protein
MAEEVDRRPLGGQKCPRRAARQQHLRRHLLAPLSLDDEVVDVLDPAGAHRLGDDGEAEDDSRLFLHDPRPCRRLRGHGGL